MLDVLIHIRPRSMSRGELGARTEIAAGGGTFGTYLGTLRRNGLIEVMGDAVRVSDALFLSERLDQDLGQNSQTRRASLATQGRAR